MNFYSQFQEDQWIYEHLNVPTRGVFVEVGAYDGVAGSNTKTFEELGWTGLLFEPIPKLAWRCRSHRYTPVFMCAAGKEPGTQPMWSSQYDDGISSLIDYPGFQAAGAFPVVRLDSILPHLGPIDLLSIDTEGTELDVWAGLGTIRPARVVIEYLTLPHPPRDKQIIDQMVKDGYRMVHRTTANLIFAL